MLQHRTPSEKRNSIISNLHYSIFLRRKIWGWLVFGFTQLGTQPRPTNSVADAPFTKMLLMNLRPPAPETNVLPLDQLISHEVHYIT